MTIVNHWGKWINSENPITGVGYTNRLSWEWVTDDICLTCEEIYSDIESNESLSEDDKQKEYDFLECDSSHTRIFGDWLQDELGKYYPDPKGKYAVIENELYIQIVFSKYTKLCSLCSPCYPGQGDIDFSGQFLTYCLPDDIYNSKE